jgi:hypothetical protein
MTVKEILEMETAKAPAPVLLLFREGIFLKAYETSAYLFHRFVKQYEVKTVYYKNINCSLLSVGFPSRYPDALVEEFDLVREAEPVEGVYRFTSVRFAFSEEEYRQFRESVKVVDEGRRVKLFHLSALDWSQDQRDSPADRDR